MCMVSTNGMCCNVSSAHVLKNPSTKADCDISAGRFTRACMVIIDTVIIAMPHPLQAPPTPSPAHSSYPTTFTLTLCILTINT